MVMNKICLLIVVLGFGFSAGYALSQKNTVAAIEPLAFYNLKADSQNTRLDLILLKYNGTSIPCVVSLVQARDGVVNRAAGSGVSCSWPEGINAQIDGK